MTVAAVALLLVGAVLTGCSSHGDAADRTAGTPPPATHPASLPAPVALPPGAWRPRPGLTWQVQYAGRIDPTLDVDVFDVDSEDTSEVTVHRIHDHGGRVLCYFSAGSWEPYRSDKDRFAKAMIGRSYAGFRDERWVDIRVPVLRQILATRLDRAKAKGCDGVDPDNVNGYQSPTGFDLTAGEQLRFNVWLFNEAHRRGLAVALKNDLSQVDELVPYVDLQVNEECIEQQECGLLRPFTKAGKPVLSIEYRGSRAAVCAEADRLGFSTVRKHLSLNAWRDAC
jgi:hypothetical protein